MMDSRCCSLPVLVFDVYPLVPEMLHDKLIELCHTAISKATNYGQLGLPNKYLTDTIYEWNEGLFCHLANKVAKLMLPGSDPLILMEFPEDSDHGVLAEEIIGPLVDSPGTYKGKELLLWDRCRCSKALSGALTRYSKAHHPDACPVIQ